jgi:spermidine/putrescine transport system ATP-binding protein
MIQTTDFCDVDEHIGLSIDPDAIHIMKKSKYSGMFGDYSSFSDEMDEIGEVEIEELGEIDLESESAHE